MIFIVYSFEMMSSDLFDSLEDINICIRFHHATCELGMNGLKAVNVTCNGKKKEKKNNNKKRTKQKKTLAISLWQEHRLQYI